MPVFVLQAVNMALGKRIALYSNCFRNKSQPSADSRFKWPTMHDRDSPISCSPHNDEMLFIIQHQVVDVLRSIYEGRSLHGDHYETRETLVDIGNNFQFWRFHHMKMVERIIGRKRGTGGSSGVPFLKKALDIEFFPELLRVRIEIGANEEA